MKEHNMQPSVEKTKVSQADVKIRILPRPGESGLREASAKAEQFGAATSDGWRTNFVMVILAVLVAGVTFLFAKVSTPKSHESVQNKASASNSRAIQDLVVNRYLKDAKIKKELIEREIRQRESMANDPEANLGTPLPADQASYGVQLDQEDPAAAIYADLKGKDDSTSEALLQEKINSRLATRKWVNEYERAERIEFVRNFLKSAYENGYEVQLDENLVVVKVKKLNKKVQKVSIDQVVNKLARDGY